VCVASKAVRARCFAQSGARACFERHPLENSHKTLNGNFCWGKWSNRKAPQTKTKLLFDRAVCLIDDTVAEEEKREEENKASI